MDLLPEDLIYEIVKKLPYISIIRFLSINVKINNLFKDKSRFITILSDSPKNSWLKRFSTPVKAYIAAARDGDIMAVNAFIKSGMDPSIQDNWALIWAARNGYKQVVTYLLKDTRVNPCAQDFKAIKEAIENNQKDTLELLIKDPRINYKKYGREFFVFARQCDRHNIADILPQTFIKTRDQVFTEIYKDY